MKHTRSAARTRQHTTKSLPPVSVWVLDFHHRDDDKRQTRAFNDQEGLKGYLCDEDGNVESFITDVRIAEITVTDAMFTMTAREPVPIEDILVPRKRKARR